MKKKKEVILEVTVKKYYAFPENGINGWPTEKVIEEWFENFDINRRHASRDGHEFSNLSMVINVVQISPEEFERAVARLEEFLDKIQKMKEKRDNEMEEKFREMISLEGEI